MLVSCDFVQVHDINFPNYGSCLSTADAMSIDEAITKAAKDAQKYAKAGKIYAIVYKGTGEFITDYIGESVQDILDQHGAETETK